MTKKEKEMEQYIKNLCRDADVEYDVESGSHMDNHEINNLLKRDIQKPLDYMVAEGFCDQVGDKYVYRETPIDLFVLPATRIANKLLKAQSKRDR